jgi:hypothetical protein
MRLLLAHDATILDLLLAHQADHGQLLFGQRDQRLVRARPQAVLSSSEEGHPCQARHLEAELEPAQAALRALGVDYIALCNLSVAPGEDTRPSRYQALLNNAPVPFLAPV